jgi:Tol biopolymer transport system component
VLVAQPGYDGGPFFSPDGTRICYRSDRRGDNLLAVYAADLVRDERGSIVRIDNEVRLTFGEHVAWAPYFTSDGATLVFSSSQAGHDNYELFAVRSTLPRDSSEPSSVRVTHAAGFDGLGVVAPDGRHLMWTSQRGPKVEGEQRPSSQLWIARFDAGALAGALDAADAERALRERSRPAN